MKLLQSKIQMEQYLSDNYTETPIHWSGMKFDSTALDEWIYFEYISKSLSDCGFNNAEFVQLGSLNIAIVAKNTFRCNQIGDVAIDLFKGKSINGLIAGEISVLSTDYASDIDKTVVELEIKFKNV